MSRTAERAIAPPSQVAWVRYCGVYLLLFLIGTETFLISPLLPTIASSVRVGTAAAASAVTAYTIVYALTAPFLGAVSDRFGRRPTIVIGAVLFLLGNVMAALAGNLGVLVLGRVVGALGAGFAGPSIWAHLSETSGEAVRGRAIGLGMALFSAGQVLGVPAGGFLAGWGGWHAPFWVLAALTVLALPLLHSQTRTPDRQFERRPLRLGAVFVIWRDQTARRALIVVLLLQAASLGAYTFLGAVLHDRFDLSVGALGGLGVLVGIGSALGSLFAGRIGDRARRHGRDDAWWIPVWAVVLGVSAVLAAWGAPLVLVAAVVLVWFVASGAFVTNVQTLLLTTRPDLAATVSSWNSATLYAGAAIGVAAVGAFANAAVGIALVGGGLALLSALTALPLASRPRSAETRTEAGEDS
ncbi:MFS transporter [Nocardia sp. NPDC046473]|uniref:MFS transporter n=1 Tax=Nocardia sp. NPDC046473 TaxID=3155733 RepID=UPI0033DC7AC8